MQRYYHENRKWQERQDRIDTIGINKNYKVSPGKLSFSDKLKKSIRLKSMKAFNINILGMCREDQVGLLGQTLNDSKNYGQLSGIYKIKEVTGLNNWAEQYIDTKGTLTCLDNDKSSLVNVINHLKYLSSIVDSLNLKITITDDFSLNETGRVTKQALATIRVLNQQVDIIVNENLDIEWFTEQEINEREYDILFKAAGNKLTSSRTNIYIDGSDRNSGNYTINKGFWTHNS